MPKVGTSFLHRRRIRAVLRIKKSKRDENKAVILRQESRKFRRCILEETGQKFTAITTFFLKHFNFNPIIFIHLFFNLSVALILRRTH